jgi:hypothetical protein
MKGKILFVTGGLVGYVLGARAGRRRYEQIRSAASKVWQKPAIQNQVHQAEEFAADKAAEVPDILISGASKLVSSLIRRARSNGGTSSNKTSSSGSGTGSSGSTNTTTGGAGSSGSAGGAAPNGSHTAATTPDGEPVVVKTTETRASTPTAEEHAE